MKKRSLLLLGLGLLIALGVVTFPSWWAYAKGTWNGESFFRGWPSSSWGKSLLDENPKRKIAGSFEIDRGGTYWVKSRLLHQLKDGGDAAVPVLIELLRHDDAYVRRAALVVLATLKSAAVGAALPGIIEATTDADSKVRRAAIRALTHADPDHVGLVPTLIAATKDADDEVSREAINAMNTHRRRRLATIEPLGVRRVTVSREAIPALIEKCTKDGDIKVRKQALEVLCQQQIDTKVLLPVLIEALKDTSLRWTAAWKLGELGPEAKTAIPALVGVLTDSGIDFPVWGNIIAGPLAIIPGGCEAAVPMLIEKLSSREDTLSRRYAAFFLGEYSQKSKASVPALLKIAQNKDDPAHAAAASAVHKIDPQAATKARVPLPEGPTSK